MKKKIACSTCGLFLTYSPLDDNEKVVCPRCNSTLTRRMDSVTHMQFSVGICIYITLFLTLTFPLLTFTKFGVSGTISLLNAPEMLQKFQLPLLALFVFLTIIVLPVLFVTGVLFVYGHKVFNLKPTIYTLLALKIIFRIKPWLMADVFIMGLIVTFIKLVGMASVYLDYAVYSYCFYAFFLMYFISKVDKYSLWSIYKKIEYPVEMKNQNYLLSGYEQCIHCLNVRKKPKFSTRCERCHSKIDKTPSSKRSQAAWALLFAALIFYIPANLYPMMIFSTFGTNDPQTIISGVIYFLKNKEYFIGLVIFMASICIPLIKIFLLFWVYWTTHFESKYSYRSSLKRKKFFVFAESIGRWSMIDVFVVALLVALIQLNQISSISPGKGVIYFCLVVICTMSSSLLFDSRMLWLRSDLNGENLEKKYGSNKAS